MTHTQHWITKLVPMVITIAAVTMVAVGGIMVISSSLKLALFETEPYTYANPDECLYDYQRMVPTENTLTEKPYRLNSEEQKICKANKEAEAKKRFQNTEKQDIVDGVSSLIVGGLLLLVLRKKKLV